MRTSTAGKGIPFFGAAPFSWVGRGPLRMGDARFDASYERVRDARDRPRAIAALGDAEVILALGGAARTGDAYVANVLTTEALNRQRRLAARFAAIAVGAAVFIVPRVLLQLVMADPRTDWPETLRLSATVALLLGAVAIGLAAYWRTKRRGSGAGV